MNIILTGFMATGKSSVGKLLAKALKYSFCDIDEMIEKEAKIKISDIFSTYGESHFRDLETKTAKNINEKIDNHVISTGGGIVLRTENMELLSENHKGGKNIIINLKASPEIILKRLGGKKDRPLLNKPNQMEEIKRLLEYRAPFYATCDLSIDTDSLSMEQVVKKICDYINSMKK